MQEGDHGYQFPGRRRSAKQSAHCLFVSRIIHESYGQIDINILPESMQSPTYNLLIFDDDVSGAAFYLFILSYLTQPLWGCEVPDRSLFHHRFFVDLVQMELVGTASSSGARLSQLT